jgi:hypothetical protein
MSHLIKLILLVIGILLVLSFFGISVQGIIESPAGQANINFVWGYILIGWNWIVNLVVDTFNFLIFWD